jgi:adenosylcobinamide-phosphate synthase
MVRALELVAAYALDARLGDPEGYPHPVRMMGRSIEALERALRARCRDQEDEIYAGCLLAGAVVGGACLCARLAMALPGRPLMEALLIYTALARKNLEDSALRVAGHLEEGRVEEARAELISLVGRDREQLDENAICAAAVESVAENFVDGVLVPLLWAAWGGAPAALAFKAISTLDSMIGHRDERYLHLGKCAAWMDDLAVFAAARLSVPLIALAARLCGQDGAAALRVGLRDRLNHPSPNSAHPEAAFAGALGVSLGGTAFYGGKPRVLPRIGEGQWMLEPVHIREAVRLLNTASVLGLGLAVMLGLRRKR